MLDLIISAKQIMLAFIRSYLAIRSFFFSGVSPHNAFILQ